jgi:hypothetical protein
MQSVKKRNHLIFNHNFSKLKNKKFIAIIPLNQSIYYNIGGNIAIFLDLAKMIIFPNIKILRIENLTLNSIPFSTLSQEIEYSGFILKNLEQYCNIKHFYENEVVSVLLLEKKN